jgi:Sulfotransferase family
MAPKLDSLPKPALLTKLQDAQKLLRPILVCGPGRGGSTALMALLTSDKRVAADQIHPFENCLLTYCLKLSLLQSRFDRPGAWNLGQMINFGDSDFGAYPYRPTPPDDAPPDAVLGQPTEVEWLRGLWQVISGYVKRHRPGAAWYAEKVPSWVPCYAGSLGAQTLHLFRDPRDLYLSANALMKRLDYYSFGRKPEDDDPAYARELASAYLMLFENYRQERGNASALCLRYEDLAKDPHAMATRLSEFLGLNLLVSAMNRSPASHLTSASLAQSVERWRHEQLPAGVESTLIDGLAEPMRVFGYELDPTKVAEAAERTFDCTERDIVTRLEPGAHGTFGDVSDNGLELILHGEDFHITLPESRRDAASIHECWLTVRGQQGTHCSVYWDCGQGFREEESIHVPFFPADHWQVVRFGFARRPAWQGTIRRLRFDICNGGRITPDRLVRLRAIRLIR